MKLHGHTKIWHNGNLIYDKKNAITNTLRQYLKERMDSNKATEAIDDDLFTTGDLEGDDNTLNDKSGIVVTTGNVGFAFSASTTFQPEEVRSMVTTDISNEATNTNGRKWRGFLTAGGPRTFSNAALVLKWDWNSNKPFVPAADTITYATQSFSRVTLAQGDTLTIEWEVFVA